MMKKKLYLSPFTESLALQSEGVICESGTEGTRSGYDTVITLDLLGD